MSKALKIYTLQYAGSRLVWGQCRAAVYGPAAALVSPNGSPLSVI